VALAAGCVMAQSSEPLKATIPFDFIVGTTTLPAGEYTVGSDFGSAVLKIRDSHREVKASVLAITGNAPANSNESHLVFRVHGTKHYLASTWNSYMAAGRQVRETKAEREMEMATGPTTQIVLLARR
jgi:hypothetical protein